MPKVILVPYSRQWPETFEALRGELLELFAPNPVVVEHIGSTVVPGLAAKSVIDLLLGADSLPAIESRSAALSAIGYQYVSKYERELPDRCYFVKPSEPRIHLHGVAMHSPLWREHLAFRDALRADSGLRSAYEKLKYQLAEQFADDKQAYTLGKSDFIRAVLRAGRQSPD